jgi:hypothetical protein
VRSVTIEYFNGLYNNSGGVEYANPNPITIAAALEVAPAVLMAQFTDGEIHKMMQPGGRARTLPIGVNLAANTTFTLDSFFKVAKLGMFLPANKPGSASSGATAFTMQSTGYPVVAGTTSPYTGFDYTQSYGFPSGRSSGYGTQAFGPLAVWGEPTNSLPTFAIFGDSIANGTNDTQSSPAIDLYWAGYIARGLGQTYPYAKFSMPGSIASNAFKFGNRKLDMMANCDFVIWEYGINEINNSTYASLSAMKTAYLGYWNNLYSAGVRVIPCTITPYTSTTDAGATASNQTPAMTNESIRTGYNSWLRDTSANGALAQAGGAVVAVADPAALVEVNSSNVLTLNGGRWIANGTANYSAGPDTGNTMIHPTSAGAILASAAISAVAAAVTL